MKREKVSPEEWRERLDRAVDAKRGRWRVLPRAIASSRAFAELSRSGLIVVLAMLDNLTYQSKSKRRDARCLQCGGLPLDNNGEFVITNNELIARGLKSPDSITRGRQEAWKFGFYDVVKTGTLMNYGIYRYSERWKNFPNGDCLPHDQPNPGKCLYPKEKRKLKPTTENVVSTTTENVVKRGENVTTENVVIETGSPTTDSVVNIIMYQEDKKDLQVHEKDPRENQNIDFSKNTFFSANTKDNQNINPAYPDTVFKGSELSSIQHQWFLDAFKEACSQKGIGADLGIDPSLASTLDDWIFKRLSKKSYFGNRCFYEEKPYNIQEKVSQIVSQWEFIEISYVGERVSIPSTPELEFLIINLEAIFMWVNEVRQRSMDVVLRRLDGPMEGVPVGYTH